MRESSTLSSRESSLIRGLVEKGILQSVSGGKYSRYELGLEGEKVQRFLH